MPRAARSLIALVAFALVIWLIWSRLHIVIWVPMPWWGLLLMGLIIFLGLDYLISKIFARRP